MYFDCKTKHFITIFYIFAIATSVGLAACVTQKDIGSSIPPLGERPLSLAEQQFLGLSFANKGQGMVLGPSFTRFYQNVRKLPIFKNAARAIIENRWGFTIIDDRVVGMTLARYNGRKILVLGCAACHACGGPFYPRPGQQDRGHYTSRSRS